MLGCEWLKLLTFNCQTTDDTQRKRQISEQIKQVKYKTESNDKGNLYTSNKGNPEADYFVVGPNIEAERATNAKIAKQNTQGIL